MHCSAHFLDLVIVGGGPAGLAPLLAAHRRGELDALLTRGVAVVEQSDVLGSGSIGDYGINSDSSGRTFTDCLRADRPSELTRLADHPLAAKLMAAGDGAVPLVDAGRFLGLVGAAVARMMQCHPASAALTGHRALSVQRMPVGWQVRVRSLATGEERHLHAAHVVLATGATQPLARLAAERIGGVDLVASCGERLLQSGDVLATGGIAAVASRLAGRAAPRVAIVGGSTSAAAVAHALLNRLPDIAFGRAGITLLHRRPLRITYQDRATALAEGYDEWTEEDVCPVSGRVFRFAGFRLDSRELVMQARGIGGRAPEPRLALHQITGDPDPVAARILGEADLVIAALGYRPNALAVLDGGQAPIPLLAGTGSQMPLVDGHCRVLGIDHAPIDARCGSGLYGIGLAAGFVPRGVLGGEPSFRGQANGLWLWQNDVGALIVEDVLGDTRQSTATENESAVLCATGV